jgi:cell wall-associated NlpC family hydrolase
VTQLREVCILTGVANAYLGGGLMRRALSALSVVLIAATVASVSLLFVPKASSAAPPWWEGGPSQGSYTTEKADPYEPSLVADTPPSDAAAEDSMFAASAAGTSRKDVVRQARRYLGTRYRYATCTASRMSCTCLTKSAWGRFGHRLPMDEYGQWRYEPSKRVRANDLRPGDIVFFAEGGGRLTHVGIYSGRGNLVHASRYFGKVVESKMRYIKGYSGAIRLKPR